MGCAAGRGAVAEPRHGTVGHRVWEPLPTWLLRVTSLGLGSAKRDCLRRALHRGWKTWSLASPAGKLRLRDPRRTGPSRCPYRDGKGDASFQTLVLRLHLCPCASGSLSTSQGIGLSTESGMRSPRNISPSAYLLLSPHSPWGFVRSRSSKKETSCRLHLEPKDPAQRWPQARLHRFQASGPVSLASETRLCSPTPASIRSAPAGPSSPSSR